jgi:hypothetical protein
VSTSPLDVSEVYAIGDDGTSYGVNASGILHDANGDATQGVTVVLVLSIDEAGNVTVESGTVQITY